MKKIHGGHGQQRPITSFFFSERQAKEKDGGVVERPKLISSASASKATTSTRPPSGDTSSSSSSSKADGRVPPQRPLITAATRTASTTGISNEKKMDKRAGSRIPLSSSDWSNAAAWSDDNNTTTTTTNCKKRPARGLGEEPSSFVSAATLLSSSSTNTSSRVVGAAASDPSSERRRGENDNVDEKKKNKTYSNTTTTTSTSTIMNVLHQLEEVSSSSSSILTSGNQDATTTNSSSRSHKKLKTEAVTQAEAAEEQENVVQLQPPDTLINPQPQHDQQQQQQSPLARRTTTTTIHISDARAQKLARMGYSSRNIVHHLFQRSAFGSFRNKKRYRSSSSSSSLSTTASASNALMHTSSKLLSWKTPSWILLQDCDSGGGGPGGGALSSSSTSCRMAWDSLGVLFAVAATQQRDQSWIRVYDWDMVRSCDLQGRNLNASKKGGGAFVVEPILRFRTPPHYAAATCLAWNPVRPDELAVGTSSGRVLVYDLGTELVGGAPSVRVLSCPVLTAKSSMAPVSGLLFLVQQNEAKYLVVCRDNKVSCMDPATSQTAWTWSWEQKGGGAGGGAGSITCIEQIPGTTNLLLLGSSTGYMAVLDATKYRRHAFSLLASPQVLGTWLSYQDLSSTTPGGSNMGIRHLQLYNKNGNKSGSGGTKQHADSSDTCSSDVVPVQLLSMTWVTSCGWVLYSSIGVPSTRQRFAKILYSTTPIKFENADGQEVAMADKSWSLPVGSSVAATGSSTPQQQFGMGCYGTGGGLLLWEKVPNVKKILPHTDQRVIDSSRPRILRDNSKPSLMMMMMLDQHPEMMVEEEEGGDSSASSPRIQTIKLSRRKGPPLALSVHPSQEWIVVATKNELYTLSSCHRGV